MTQFFNEPGQFVPVSTPDYYGLVHREWADTFANPAAFFATLDTERGRVLRGGSGKGLTAAREIESQRVFVKQYGPGRLTWRLRDTLLGAMCFREWKCNCRATSVGVSTAGILAVLAERGLRSSRRVVVSLHADGHCLKYALRGAPSDEIRRGMIDELGRFVAEMHNAGLFHPNLHWKHIFVRDGSEFTLIDLDRAFVCAPLPERLARRNLRCLTQSLGKELPSDYLNALAESYRRHRAPSARTGLAARLRQARILAAARLEHLIPGLARGPRRAAAP